MFTTERLHGTLAARPGILHTNSCTTTALRLHELIALELHQVVDLVDLLHKAICDLLDGSYLATSHSTPTFHPNYDGGTILYRL
jgi:hypothetical protein